MALVAKLAALGSASKALPVAAHPVRALGMPEPAMPEKIVEECAPRVARVDPAPAAAWADGQGLPIAEAMTIEGSCGAACMGGGDPWGFLVRRRELTVTLDWSGSAAERVIELGPQIGQQMAMHAFGAYVAGIVTDWDFSWDSEGAHDAHVVLGAVRVSYD